jgi:hypothetical protein
MGVAVIADLMSGGSGGSSDGGQPLHIHSADEKGGRCVVLIQDIEQLVRPFTGSIVKSKGNRSAPSGTAIDRRRKQS